MPAATMPINPAGECKPAVTLGSGRRKGRPRKLLLSPCRSVVSSLKGTEVIHRTRKNVRNVTPNTITNYFSAPRPAAAPLEAAECPPPAGPPPAPPQQGARRRRSCLAAAEDTAQPPPPPPTTSAAKPKRSWVPAAEHESDSEMAGRPASPAETGLAAEAAGTPRTPVSPHKIQSLDCQPLTERPRRPPLSPALDLNKASGRAVAAAAAGLASHPRQTSGAAAGGQTHSQGGDGQHKLTDFFPIRRSKRRTRRALEEEKSCEVRRRLRQECDEGLRVALFPGKGRGVVAARPFLRGEFVVEYSGSLVTPEQARQRERLYAQDQNTGCYMYYFTCHGRSWCIDGTAESERLGRLVNHSRTANNCVTRSLEVDGNPRLVLIAKHDIAEGQEILYDYGDRSKESLQHHPWLAF